MGKVKELFSNYKIWIYIVFFVITIISISPRPWMDGVAIRTVSRNSTAENAGLSNPAASAKPINRERIVSINNIPVNNEADFRNIIESMPQNTTLTITTETTDFWLFDSQTTYTARFRGQEKLGLKVYDSPKSNILLGLDLQGGTRVVLQPEERVSSEDMDILISNMEQRLNIFGLSDTVIRPANDLSGNQFIIVEIAGANEEEVKDLIARQGKFEAKIGNESVFLGGDDITYVCRTAQCSRVECGQARDGTYACNFRFQITLTQEAAQRQANITERLDVVYDQGAQGYLSQPLDLYLDDALVDSLNIAADLKGVPATDISISGPGVGRSRQEALEDAQQSMKQLQTVLITGSLPVKLNVIKTDTLSPSLGREFLTNAMLIGVLSTLAVTAIVLIRYRRIKIALPIITIITSEILLILGISALLRQNLDIAGIAGIIVAIGTGVDDQIVITDEILQGGKKQKELDSWASRIKKAFFIVVAAYFATVAAMVPLLFAGAGLLKGFAITTIIGVTNGVFVTRPAFAEMMKILLEE